MSSAGELTLEWWGPGTVPAPASIVWCNFPLSESLGHPGPKPRPGLVFKARYVDNPPGDRFYVLVAYGTSVTKVGARPNDFMIGTASLLDILRLPQATRFDLDRVLWLPWARPFFMARTEERYATPTISVLPQDMQRMLQWTMASREQRGLNAGYHSAPTPVGPGE